MPSGWTLVAFAGNQSSSCPVQGTQSDVYEGPNTSSVCGCGCDLSTPPTCPAGPIAANFDQSQGHPTCTTMGVPPTMNNAGACNTDMYTGMGLFMPGYQSFDLSYTPAPPANGQCTPRTVRNSGNLTYAAQDRVCVPSTEPCTGSDCTPSFGSYQVCIAASGNQPSCPGSTFTQKHVVGGAATFTCSGSSCTCSVNEGTCTGTLTLHTNTNCTGGTLVIPADGSCNDESGAGSNTYQSYSYVANPLNSSCTSGGTSTAQNVTQPNEQTICCAQ